LSETASDVRHTLARVGRTDEVNLIGEVCAAADTIVPLLWNLDTTTDGDVVIDAGSAGPVPADNSADPFIAVCAPVRRLRSRFVTTCKTTTPAKNRSCCFSVDRFDADAPSGIARRGVTIPVREMTKIACGLTTSILSANLYYTILHRDLSPIPDEVAVNR
jgi:hypothetical protein